MQKLKKADFLKKFSLSIPNFKNYEEVKKMDAPLIANGLDELIKWRIPSWKLGEKAIEKKFEFQDFKKAFGFMTEVAHIAEYIDHHPEWSNVYNKLNVRLNSHYCNGVTMRDLFLAFAMVNLKKKILIIMPFFFQDKIQEKSGNLGLGTSKMFESELKSGGLLKEWNE